MLAIRFSTSEQWAKRRPIENTRESETGNKIRKRIEQEQMRWRMNISLVPLHISECTVHSGVHLIYIFYLTNVQLSPKIYIYNTKHTKQNGSFKRDENQSAQYRHHRSTEKFQSEKNRIMYQKWCYVTIYHSGSWSAAISFYSLYWQNTQIQLYHRSMCISK